MDIKVKCEVLNSLCHGCLSVDRRVRSIIGEFNEVFRTLRNNEKHDILGQELQLCWECIAFLKKLKTFQTQIRTAQQLLLQYLQSYYIKDETPIPNSLSLLQKQIKTDTSNIIIYNEEEKYNIEQNYFNTEINNLNKKLNFDNEVIRIIDDIDIKEESNDNIKDEFDNNMETEDFQELSIEYVEPEATKPKKNLNSITTNNNRKKYSNFADKIKRIDVSNVNKYSEKVCLNAKQYEELVEKERKKVDGSKMAFQCKQCNVGYNSNVDLLRHFSFCHNEKATFPYKCPACPTMITSVEHLDQHWTNTHTAMLKCTLCFVILRTNNEMKYHLKHIHSKIYSCKECAQEYGCLKEFMSHYRTTHEQKLICDYCNMSLRKKKSLITHITLYHIPAYCSICNRHYNNRKNLKNHNIITHPELLSIETRKELSYCVECDKQYPSIYKYKKHLQDSARHTPQKKFRIPCPECGKIFTRNSFMKNHFKFAHLKVTKHYCDQCKKYYTNGYGLRKHIDRVHKKIPQPKTKICDICGRGFGTNRILINHRRTHTGERPHKCEYCPAAFAQETAMKSHQKSQHKNVCLELVG